PVALAVYIGLSLWNYVSHAGIRLDFGRGSWLLNSPAYHRRHHSSDPEHYGSNFAALFPIFDVIAGSYRRPDGYPPTGLEMRPETLADLVLWPLRRNGLAADEARKATLARP
ncbi:MAG: sterol desaturase family protein, partial [Croceibacterium sp.]